MISVTTTFTRPTMEQPFFFESDTTFTPHLIQNMFDNELILEQSSNRSQDELTHSVVAKFVDQNALNAFLIQMEQFFGADIYFAARDAYCSEHGHTVTRTVA